MNSKMTPCEKRGYKVGDKFTITEYLYRFSVGEVISLQNDDGTETPYFTSEKVKDEYPRGVACFLSYIKKVAKLKPAKQALADAIRKNGGWPNEKRWTLATSNGLGHVFCWTDKPHRDTWNWTGGTRCISIATLGRIIPNWHQTILSRDEYFTAYPEQVKVEINNEIERKDEAEMKSESKMTIKVGDWHKNGELPPVGEVVMLNSTNTNDYWAHHVGAELTVVAHDKGSRGVGIAVYRFVGADGYNEYHGLVAEAFKPILTERDKEIEEMVDLLSSRWANCEAIAAHLYENGYRKEVK